MNAKDKLGLLLRSPFFQRIEQEEDKGIQSRRQKDVALMAKGTSEELAAVRDYERKAAVADAAVADALRVLQEVQAVRSQLSVDLSITVGPIQDRVTKARNFLNESASPMIGRFVNWCEGLRRHLRHNTPPGKVAVTFENNVMYATNERKEKVNWIIREIFRAMQVANELRFKAIDPEALPERLYQVLVDHDITDPSLWFGYAPFNPHAEPVEALGLHLAMGAA